MALGDRLLIHVINHDLTAHAAIATRDGVQWGIVRRDGFSWHQVARFKAERPRVVRGTVMSAIGGVAGGAIGLLAGPISAAAGFAAGVALLGRRRRIALRCELTDGRFIVLDIAAGQLGRIRDWHDQNTRHTRLLTNDG